MLQNTIIELWHLSKTALAGTVPTRHDRMSYIKRSLMEHYPSLVKDMSGKKIWFEIEYTLEHN